MNAPRPSAWSDDAAEFVAAFREEVADVADVADAADVAAAWAQFEEVMDPAETRRRVPLVWIGTAAAVALVWVVVSATSMHSTQSEPGQQATDRAATGSGDIAPSRSPGAESRTGEQDSREIEAVAAIPTEVSPGAARLRRPVTAPPRARAKKPEPAPVASRLAEELRLLDAMRTASKAGRHADALRMVREHAAAFESGSFAAERELAKVRALCGLGRLEQVRAAQARFAKSHPASHLASLVWSACPDAAKKEIQESDHDR